MGQGSRENDFEFVMILVTRSSITVEKVEIMGGGLSGVMGCEFRNIGKVELFSVFYCEELHKSVSQKLRGIYRWDHLGWSV